MTSPFPQESIEIIQTMIARSTDRDPKIKYHSLYRKASHIAVFCEDMPYGFISNLSSGNYTTWPHERYKDQVTGLNCTTIIPYLVISLEELGVSTQIVQFVDQVDIKSKKKPDTNGINTTHFAIIADVGRKNKYLIDPFWKVYNPILENNEHYLRLGKNGHYNLKKREFKEIRYCSHEDFVEMMNKLKEPAQSLEMLISGQKIYQKNQLKIMESPASLMIYYNEELNRITTRLNISQLYVSDKSILCHLDMDDSGRVRKTSLELFLADESTWMDLPGAVKVAEFPYSFVGNIRKTIGKAHSEGKVRVGSLCSRIKQLPGMSDLLENTEELFSQLSFEQKKILYPKLVNRFLYEVSAPLKKHHFRKKDREQHLIDLEEIHYEFLEKLLPLTHRQKIDAWDIKKLTKKTKANIKDKIETLNDGNDKVVDEINDLNRLRRNFPSVYHRLMDKVLYAQNVLPKLDTEQFANEIENNQSIIQIGYLAMINDFIPYIHRARNELLLSRFQKDIGKRVRLKKSTDKNK